MLQGQTRTEALQAEIDATVAIMHENINKVSERGERLDSLQGKTEDLVASAASFRSAANKQQSNWYW
ncbi:synaptobrevin, partial [Phaeosphaeriaceae sp. SRC1lsM3a]